MEDNDVANQQRAEQKKLMFDSLYALDDSDEDDDPGLLASYEALKGKTIGDSTLPVPIMKKRKSAIAQSPFVTFPITTNQPSPTPKRSTVQQLLDDAEALKKPPSEIAAVTDNEEPDAVKDSVAPPSSAIPRPMGKRKRDSDRANIKLVAEENRIFSGLHFYFFPNDDINPNRRSRIIKALEYGATWQKDWNSAITHVIVDSGMKWESVINHLTTKGGLSSKQFPPEIVVVNQGYPSVCITHRMIVNPRHIQHLVTGYTPQPSVSNLSTNEPGSTIEPPITAPSQLSNESLQLKPPGKSVMAKYPQSRPGFQDTPSPSTPPKTVPSNDDSTGERNVGTADGDELDAAIRDAKETEDIAIEGQRGTSAWQQRFQCMHKHTGEDNAEGPNSRTISILQELADYYVGTKDQWRAKSYRSAVSTLRNHSSHVATKAEAVALHGIGESIAEKIEEIVMTNRLRKLDYTKLDPRQKILQMFMKIYGVGYAVAEKWASAGYRTLDDVVKKADLTLNQRIGIEHYDHFNARIPRNEVERHAQIVRSALQGLDDKYQIITMGSYRRGAESSGDIDLLITKPKVPLSEIREMVVEKLVPLLTKSGFLVAALAQSSAIDGTKWHGASCLPNAHIWRRIDLLLVPEDELGAALIYFTGNDIFNRSLRLLAGRKGMRLNQRGLYKDVMRGPDREKLTEGQLVTVEGRDERAIFEALGVPWRPPHHRVC